MQSAIKELQRSDSITQNQKAKLCSSLVHRIRIIQGHTNINYTEPHFIESKESIRQSRELINSMKEGVRRGCSDVLTLSREKNRFSSDTNSSLAENERSIKKRHLRSLTDAPDKSLEKDGVKMELKKTKNLYNVASALYEGGERPDSVSIAGLSETVGKENEKGMRMICNIVAEDKITKKKKKRKRKRDEIEITSSMTIPPSKVNVCNFIQGDSRPPRLNSRKNRERYTNRRRPECSGDESDIEDEVSSGMNNISETRTKFARRKLRQKHTQRRTSSLSLTQNERDVRDMVSTTITKLNNVNDHVKKVIEESLSSGSSYAMEKSVRTNSKKTITDNVSQTHSQNASATSLNCFSSTLSRSTLVDVSEISKSVSLQTQPSDKRHSQTQATVVSTPVTFERKSLQTPPAPPPTAESGVVATTTTEQVSTPKSKRKKQKTDTSKVERETVEVTTAKETPKKKKIINNNPPVNPAEPVSSMKKTGKKKKDKKKEHVNFVTTPPEVVPDYHSEVVPPIPTKKSVKIINASATPADNQKQQKSPPTQENTITAQIKKSTTKPTRRVSSAKTYRQSVKKLPKIKSTGNLDSTRKDSPITVRSVLEEEANNERKRSNSKGRNRSGSRDGHRPRSKSGSRDGNRSRSKSGSERDQLPRSREVREIYYKIRTNTTNTIANINEQMSSTLKESIAHLNDICGKVRNTLTDMEKDEQTYKRLKSKQSFEVSSEGGGSTISVQTNKTTSENAPTKSGDKPTIKSHTYTVITQPCEDTSIGQLISSISMGGDNFMVEKPHAEVAPTPPSKEKKKRKSRDCKKRPPSKPLVARPKTISPTISSSKGKFATVKKTISNDKTSFAKIPIWQRKPPSVIEEIQLTVKKQATKSQYREFLRTLKSIARKQRSQVHVVPQEFREIMEKQQDKVFDAISKHKLVIKKKKEFKPTVEANKECKNCSSDTCTCGVTVENTTTASNLQRSNWLHARTDPARKGIQVYDILDEITLKDVEPIQSEYPRKDHISDADANKRVEDTLLYKLLYHEDPKVLESLLKSSCPPIEEHKNTPKISSVKPQERPKSVSDAYRLYEQLEFNADKQPSLKLTPTKGSICLKSTDNSKVKEKPRAVDTCTKDFDDELVIPDDLKPTMKTQVVNSARKSCKKKYCHIKLKSDDEIASLRSRKRIEDKLKILTKTSSVKSIDRRSRRNRFSKENIKSRLKNYNADSKYKIKKILTVMPISIVRNKGRLKKGRLVNVEKSEAQRDLKISEENMAKINSMTKREIIQILKPYIFFDLQPPVITVMPVHPKYNYQNKHQKQDNNNHLNKAPTFKKIMGYLKDHDDDCHSGKKLCRRCQMLMQSGDETTKKNETPGAKKIEPLNQRQLWKNKYKPTPAENLVNRILGKKASRKKFQAVPPDENANIKDVVVTMTPRELNRNAANTRSKLDEVRNLMENHKPLLGQHLDDIIDALEFRIIDALSNPKNHHTDAFNEIEFDIKNILSTISELRELNQEEIRAKDMKLKSNTNIDLDESSEPCEMKSKTDINLISSINKLIEDETLIINKEEIITTPILEETVDVTIEEDEPVVEEEMNDEKKIDETYSNLGKDIEKVIEGLDAIMSINEEPELKEKEQEMQEVKEEIVVQAEENLSPECEDAMTTFCEQMDEVMKNLGNIDESNVSTDTLDAFITEDLKEKKSDEYLTPFMKAVKNYRRNEQTQNFLDFLDKLTMLSKETVSLTIYPRMPMYQATIKRNAQVIQIAKTYNQAIQCEGEEITTDGIVDVDENFYEANASIDTISHAKEEAPNRDDVLSTNHWMQTEEIKMDGVELGEIRDRLVQTSSTEVQFHEVEEYIDSFDDAVTYRKNMPFSEKTTQVPSEPEHTCFAQNSSKDVQVTSDLLEMTSITVGNQTGGFSNQELMDTATSAECQVGSDITESNFGNNSSQPVHMDESVIDCNTTEKDVEQVATVDMSSMEKYTNRLENCFGGNVSDISFNDSPRTAYTDSYITREKNSLLGSDFRLRDRANSYPTTKRSSNIISLFESHKGSDDTNYTRDFLEDGFGKSPANSYDSMLARCASSDTEGKTPSSITAKKSESNVISPNSKRPKCNNASSAKLVGQENQEDYRHKNLLNSVYGIVFVLMFLGINLNYGCYN